MKISHYGSRLPVTESERSASDGSVRAARVLENGEKDRPVRDREIEFETLRVRD
jgi:hypothetical protein